MFHYFIVQLYFWELIFHLNAGYNHTKYWIMTSLVSKYQYWPSKLIYAESGLVMEIRIWTDNGGGRQAEGGEKWEEGTQASSPEESRRREGRLWSKRAGGAKDIQRGPTVVVSDGGAASTHPANTHQEPDTHTHT